MDGANGQMSLTTSEESLEEDERQKICLSKHSAAVEQMADIQAGFQTLKSLVNKLTFEEIPIQAHGLKRIVDTELKRNVGKLNLPKLQN